MFENCINLSPKIDPHTLITNRDGVLRVDEATELGCKYIMWRQETLARHVVTIFNLMNSNNKNIMCRRDWLGSHYIQFVHIFMSMPDACYDGMFMRKRKIRFQRKTE